MSKRTLASRTFQSREFASRTLGPHVAVTDPNAGWTSQPANRHFISQTANRVWVSPNKE